MANHQRIPGHLTVPEGLAIQSEQLARWKPKLNPALYAALEAEAARQNYELGKRSDVTGYDVWRGGDISMFVENWQPANPAE